MTVVPQMMDFVLIAMGLQLRCQRATRFTSGSISAAIQTAEAVKQVPTPGDIALHASFKSINPIVLFVGPF